LARVHAATQALANGDLKARIGKLGPEDEIDDLARTFDRMADDIDQRINALGKSEQALFQATEEALDANNTKSNFLAKMSHELRTPLNAIIGFAEIMQSGHLGTVPERMNDYPKHIFDSGRHLLNIVNDILDVSKIEAGQMELYEAFEDIPALIADAVQAVEPLAAKGSVTLTCQVPDNLPALFCDKTRVHQVLLNIISNAVKFSPAGDVVISGDVGDAGISIAVKDNGIGIQKNMIAVALTPFAQVDNQAYTNKNEGTGLGLPLSKMLMELHLGSIEIDSLPGEGTTVTLSFPAERTMS
jgi:signal transduction histidine kinase